MNSLKLSATIALAIGGAVVGLIAGWETGPLTLELSRTDLALIGSVGTGLFFLTCSCLATERAEARAHRQREIARLAMVTKQVRAIRSRPIAAN
jgi:hypothetical protein